MLRVGGVRCRQAERRHGHEQVGACCHEHTEAYLDGGLGLLAFLGEPSEEAYADGGEQHYEAGIELLEDGCGDVGLGTLLILIDEPCGTGYDEDAVDGAGLVALALEDAEEAIDYEDDSQKVDDVKLHGGETGGLSGYIVAGEVGEGGAVLVEGHPEEDYYCEDEAEADDALLGLRGGELVGLVVHGGSGGILLVGGEHLLEGALEAVVDKDADDE